MLNLTQCLYRAESEVSKGCPSHEEFAATRHAYMLQHKMLPKILDNLKLVRVESPIFHGDVHEIKVLNTSLFIFTPEELKELIEACLLDPSRLQVFRSIIQSAIARKE